MLSTMLQSLIAPRYPRRYIGRHRARTTIQIASRFSSSPGIPTQRTAEPAEESAV